MYCWLRYDHVKDPKSQPLGKAPLSGKFRRMEKPSYGFVKCACWLCAQCLGMIDQRVQKLATAASVLKIAYRLRLPRDSLPHSLYVQLHQSAHTPLNLAYLCTVCLFFSICSFFTLLKHSQVKVSSHAGYLTFSQEMRYILWFFATSSPYEVKGNWWNRAMFLNSLTCRDCWPFSKMYHTCSDSSWGFTVIILIILTHLALHSHLISKYVYMVYFVANTSLFSWFVNFMEIQVNQIAKANSIAFLLQTWVRPSKDFLFFLETGSQSSGPPTLSVAMTQGLRDICLILDALKQWNVMVQCTLTFATLLFSTTLLSPSKPLTLGRKER